MRSLVVVVFRHVRSGWDRARFNGFDGVNKAAFELGICSKSQSFTSQPCQKATKRFLMCPTHANREICHCNIAGFLNLNAIQIMHCRDEA